MIEGTTRKGFAFSIPDNAVDNMELLDAMAEVEESENALAMSRILQLLIGKEQRKHLYDSLRTEDGRVPIPEAAEALKDMLEAMGQKGKNSEPSPE